MNKRPLTRYEVHKDGTMIANGLYTSSAQVLEVLLPQLLPAHQWELIRVIIPVPEDPKPFPMPPGLGLPQLSTADHEEPQELSEEDKRQQRVYDFYVNGGAKPE